MFTLNLQYPFSFSWKTKMAADETSYTSLQFVHMLCPIWLTKPLLGERGEFNIAYSICRRLLWWTWVFETVKNEGNVGLKYFPEGRPFWKKNVSWVVIGLHNCVMYQARKVVWLRRKAVQIHVPEKTVICISFGFGPNAELACPFVTFSIWHNIW